MIKRDMTAKMFAYNVYVFERIQPWHVLLNELTLAKFMVDNNTTPTYFNVF